MTLAEKARLLQIAAAFKDDGATEATVTFNSDDECYEARVTWEEGTTETLIAEVGSDDDDITFYDDCGIAMLYLTIDDDGNVELDDLNYQGSNE